MTANKAQLTLTTSDPQTLIVQVAGDWTLQQGFIGQHNTQTYLQRHPNIQRIRFDCDQLERWDSCFIASLHRVHLYAVEHQITIEWQTLPNDMQRLVGLILKPTQPASSASQARYPWHVALGHYIARFFFYLYTLLYFIGELAMSFCRWITGRATFSYLILGRTFYDAGAKVLPAITLTGLLLGAVLAFGGVKPLQLLNQEILVADIIGYGIVRQAAPLFTALFLLLRMGAGITAEISQMQEQRQMDALRVNGLSAMDYAILPRVLGLVFVAPILCLYLDCIGIIGGMVPSIWYFDLNPYQLYQKLLASFNPVDIYAGLFKATCLSFLVGVISCQRGMFYLALKSRMTETVASTLVIGLLTLLIGDFLLTYLLNQLGI